MKITKKVLLKIIQETVHYNWNGIKFEEISNNSYAFSKFNKKYILKRNDKGFWQIFYQNKPIGNEYQYRHDLMSSIDKILDNN